MPALNLRNKSWQDLWKVFYGYFQTPFNVYTLLLLISVKAEMEAKSKPQKVMVWLSEPFLNHYLRDKNTRCYAKIGNSYGGIFSNNTFSNI